MMFTIEWEMFHSKFFNNNTIFILEKDDKWCFYTHEGTQELYAEKMKSEETEENIMFVERYINDKANLIKIIGTDEPVVEELIEEEEEEDDFEVIISDGH